MKFTTISTIVLTIASSLTATLKSQHHGQFGLDWTGNVRLDRDFRKVTVHEQYLEIEEEVELSATEGSDGIPSQSLQAGIELNGTISLPSRSVLCGAVLWDGDKLLKAKLKTKSDSYNEYQDSTDTGTVWTPSTADPLMISLNYRDTVDVYDFNLYAVKWGETRRLKIRYLQPIVYGSRSGAQMNQRGVFEQVVQQIPTDFTVELKGAPGVTSIKLESKTSTMNYPLSETPLALILPYQENSELKIGRPNLGEKGKMYTTKIDTGVLAGEYLHYFSTIPEELFRNAGLKREVVFLWRWENENSLVGWKNQVKFFSEYGVKALDQAYQIQSCASRLLDAQAGVALYHDRTEGSADTTFGMSLKGSESAKSMMNYLSYLTADNGANIVSGISGYDVKSEADGTPLTAEQIDSISQAGVTDFEIAVTAIKTMFSPDDRIIKHIVLITAGKRKTDSNILYTKSIAGLENVTFSGYGVDSKFADGYWPGVDIKKIATARKIPDGGETMYGIQLPKEKTANFTLYLQSTKQRKAFTIDGTNLNGFTDYSNITFTGHAAESWSDTVVWFAHDLSGKEIGTYTQIPERIKTENDTDLIMLWGGSSTNPYSEKITSGSVGYLVGFVDEKYSLLAMPYDSVSAELKKKIEDGEIPNLSRDEIFGPADDQITTLADATKTPKVGIHTILTTSTGVRIKLNTGSSVSAQLIIYDLMGRVIARFTNEQLMGKSELIWDGVSGSGKVSRGFYIARLMLNGNTVSSLKFTI